MPGFEANQSLTSVIKPRSVEVFEPDQNLRLRLRLRFRVLVNFLTFMFEIDA
jgi:hypothetical protein|tara:strand:- start:630 stop:785 length:156 start_codon:yes stop_codon:yes gene_type:complete